MIVDEVAYLKLAELSKQKRVQRFYSALRNVLLKRSCAVVYIYGFLH